MFRPPAGVAQASPGSPSQDHPLGPDAAIFVPEGCAEGHLQEERRSPDTSVDLEHDDLRPKVRPPRGHGVSSRKRSLSLVPIETVHPIGFRQEGSCQEQVAFD